MKSFHGLEAKLEDFKTGTLSDSRGVFYRETYRSESERIVAGIFENEDIRFEYESPLSVDVDDKGDQGGKVRGRTWHPDFYLNDLGVIVEYVGLPDDEEYMEGIRKKGKTYEEMGLKVAWIYPEDIWDESNGKYRMKESASETVLNKVYEAARSSSVITDLYGSGMGVVTRSGSGWNRYAAVS